MEQTRNCLSVVTRCNRRQRIRRWEIFGSRCIRCGYRSRVELKVAPSIACGSSPALFEPKLNTYNWTVSHTIDDIAVHKFEPVTKLRGRHVLAQFLRRTHRIEIDIGADYRTRCDTKMSSHRLISRG